MKNLDKKLIAAAKLARKGYRITEHEGCGRDNGACFRVELNGKWVGYVARESDGLWWESVS